MTRPLRVGDRFRNHPDTGDERIYEVLRATPGGLTVRSLSTTHTEFETAGGDEVAFDKPGRRFTICHRPLGVQLLAGEGEQNE
jgi:hypothetical protein